MNSEPPAEYVAFVARQLGPLRHECGLVAGERDADMIYPEALASVAARWEWLQAKRRLLRRPDAAEVALWHAVERHTNSWRPPEQEIEIAVFRDDELPPPPVAVSNAVRLAPLMGLPTRFVAGAFCEAAIAWCHRAEVRRRWALYFWIGVMVLMVALIARLSTPVDVS